MIRHPPRSPLFPSTTLSRSASAVPHAREDRARREERARHAGDRDPVGPPSDAIAEENVDEDRKSTRLNSSHSQISYAVFCLKKKKQMKYTNFVHTPHVRMII